MVEFPQDYFDDEVRDGFYVNGLMKRCWAAQIEVLSDIASVCDKYNIKWYADCGTLLGAVRHGGFVPWDDDLDICMFRDDYMKFIEVAEKELKGIWKGYKLFNFRNGDYWEVISRVVDMHSLSFEEDRTRKFHGFPLEVGVDIFPLDFLSVDREREEKRMAICNCIFSIADDKRLKRPDKYINDTLSNIEEATGYTFDRKKSLQMQLYTLGEEMFSMFDRKQAKYAALMGYWLKDESHRYDLGWYEHTVMLPFENIKIPVPAGYDSALKTEYGDYMKIVRTGGAHNYPRYGEQIEEIDKELGDESPFCKKVPKDLLTCVSGLSGMDGGVWDSECLSTDEGLKPKVNTVKRDYGNGNPRMAVKNQIRDLSGLLAEAHVEIKRLLENGNVDDAVNLLADCQNTAIYLGTFIEENYGEGFITVKYLEEYCEVVYRLSEDIFTNESNAEEIYDILNKGLQTVNDSIEGDIKAKREVVFIPYKTELWKYMEALWKKHIDEPDTEVYVVPAPFYRKSATGKLEAERYEGDIFPEYVTVTDYRAYNFKERQPDVVYIQNPFDNDNFSMTIHPYFYASRLKQYTDELIYVQSFIGEEIHEGEERSYKAMLQYAVSPGVIYADRVIVQSEHMKEMYVKKLTDYYGEETAEIWDAKISGNDAGIYNFKEDDNYKMFNDFKDMIYRKNGSRKKVVLYFTSVCGLYENGERMIEKIKSVFSTFKERANDITLVWYPDPSIDEVIEKSNKSLWEKYRELIEEYVEADFGIILTADKFMANEGTDVECLIDMVDAYYGDTDKLVTKCMNRRIPVMIQNVDV